MVGIFGMCTYFQYFNRTERVHIPVGLFLIFLHFMTTVVGVF